MASLSDVRALTISDENASDDDRLVTAADLTPLQQWQILRLLAVQLETS